MPSSTKSISTERDARYLPFSAPLLGPEETRELLAAAESGWLTAGPRTRRFEEAFREYVGTADAVATSSCTAALHLALRALDVGPGDAVLTSPFTFAATANVIVHCGAGVLFADISPHTYNLDPGAVAQVLEEHCRATGDGSLEVRASGHRLRALIAVHYGGQCCAMNELDHLARRYRFAIIEDAAHAAGSQYRGRSAGTLGRAGCFSFYPTKNMTTGEGGMLTTDDPRLAARARQLSQHGISRDGWQRYSGQGDWRYDVEEAGYKYNMTDLLAAIGLHQLRRLDRFVERRRELAARYDRALVGRSDLALPREERDSFHSRHLYTVEVASSRVTRDGFIAGLRQRNIGSSVHFIPLHLTSFYRRRCGYQPGDFPVAERVFERIVSLPLFPAMTDHDADRVIEACVETLEAPVDR